MLICFLFKNRRKFKEAGQWLSGQTATLTKLSDYMKKQKLNC